MGWRNLFIKISKNNTQESSNLATLYNFIDHHNNWQSYFKDHEIKKMFDDDEIPGEEINPYFFCHNIDNGIELWANVGNHGGSAWTEMWVEKYFPNIKIYNSTDWPYYNMDWTTWPTITKDELIKKMM